MSVDYISLSFEKSDGVAEVTLRGPGKGNAMGPDFWREMPELFDSIDQDRDVRAVIIRGAGGHFSFGLDLMAMMGQLGADLSGTNLAAERSRMLDTIGSMQQACDRVANCRKPVLAAVSGWCIGGGLDLAAACDIGEGPTRELAFTGRDIDAVRALQIGLVNEVCETTDTLMDTARAMVNEIASNPSLVVQGIKQVMNYCQDKSIADGLRYVAVWNSAFLQSHDLTEAITAFKERRAPRFQGH